MTECPTYQEYETGYLDETAFREHLSQCALCQASVRKDARLLRLARQLEQPEAASDLWERIADNLGSDHQNVHRFRNVSGAWFSRRASFVIRVAAIVLLVIGGGLIIRQKVVTPSSALLTSRTLRKVEKQEQAYVAAIDALEEVATSKLAELDITLALLYRDRLETIDAQIARCRDALQSNPANAHIRQYMLAALQEKKEALKTLLTS